MQKQVGTNNNEYVVGEVLNSCSQIYMSESREIIDFKMFEEYSVFVDTPGDFVINFKSDKDAQRFAKDRFYFSIGDVKVDVKQNIVKFKVCNNYSVAVIQCGTDKNMAEKLVHELTKQYFISNSNNRIKPSTINF